MICSLVHTLHIAVVCLGASAAFNKQSKNN